MFAGGFAVVSPLMSPGDADAPAKWDYAQGPDGSIYVTDDVAGRIWRIIYTGS